MTDTGFPDSLVAQQLRLGLEFHNAGRIDEAIAAYQRGLAESGNPSDHRPISDITDLHFRLGNAFIVRGDLEAAAENYKAALRIAPNLTSCWCNLGNVFLKWDRSQDAIAVYTHALSLNPQHWAARTNLAQALVATHQNVIAKALLTELIAERPLDAKLHNQLGRVHFELGELEQALQCFQQAVAFDPKDADSNYWIGSIKQKAGELDAAELAYARAAQLQPLIRRQNARSASDFRVLALFAPFGGNTPTEYLFKDAPYDVSTLPLFANNTYDVPMLRRQGDIVVNLLSDADQGQSILPVAAALADELGLPVLNDPRKVQRTTRETVAQLLQGIPDCRIPKVLRYLVGTDPSVAALKAVLDFKFPLLARPSGTHGGDDFEKIENLEELAAFIGRSVDADHYLIEYVDYRSADGFFRKYRFIFVNDEILPYHLAIDKGWKVHHDSTDMDTQAWTQLEEHAFLQNPAAVFSPAHFQALRTIQETIGLEYSGIDCGLDCDGQLVVFEVNASMLVHEHNEAFPYKAPFVRRIKLAFDEMVQKLAAGSQGKSSLLNPSSSNATADAA